jgi:hypothetical protein
MFEDVPAGEYRVYAQEPASATSSANSSRPHTSKPAGAIAALYEFAPREEGEGAEADNQNGQAVEEELVEA